MPSSPVLGRLNSGTFGHAASRYEDLDWGMQCCWQCIHFGYQSQTSPGENHQTKSWLKVQDRPTAKPSAVGCVKGSGISKAAAGRALPATASTDRKALVCADYISPFPEKPGCTPNISLYIIRQVSLPQAACRSHGCMRHFKHTPKQQQSAKAAYTHPLPQPGSHRAGPSPFLGFSPYKKICHLHHHQKAVGHRGFVTELQELSPKCHLWGTSCREKPDLR